MSAIRAAHAADEAALAPLIARFRVELKGYTGIRARADEAAAAAEFREYIEASFPMFFCDIDGVPVGYIVCRVDAPTVWVESLFVSEEYRRKGVAGALFAQAERIAQSYGEDTLYHFVHPNNHGMIRFLARRGYDVLNLIEIRKRLPGEDRGAPITVGEHTFRYGGGT